ncbi:YbaK/EbsC family protein [Spongiactinospora sp. TRM90649]|uniref:YbaK/EbsC family protein n=1 Tax=Spongiactinospora sp. TRM90649 TaxID=3031114 RepID=UPI0023F798AA|nr:YbaK/EbsC family protein [Spongiactinospora sp. TRM90649]MDF5753419.1 YbaK/EbsC family protein [Spongiactinospora sp. TRM90649]
MGPGNLSWTSAAGRTDLLAEPVAAAVAELGDEVRVTAIDPELADTAAFCERYEVGADESANCVIVAAKRGGEVRYAACLVLATMRADVNGVVRRHLEARKTSFAPQDDAVRLTGMEYGGITPLGLPDDWPVLIDAAVAAHPDVVIGSGLRRSKIALPGSVLAGLKSAEVLELAN